MRKAAEGLGLRLRKPLKGWTLYNVGKKVAHVGEFSSADSKNEVHTGNLVRAMSGLAEALRPITLTLILLTPLLLSTTQDVEDGIPKVIANPPEMISATKWVLPFWRERPLRQVTALLYSPQP